MDIPKTSNKQGVFLTGFGPMMSRLEQLSSPRIRDRIIKAGLGAGLNRIRTAIRKEAPKGKLGSIKAAIGRQIKKGKQGGVWFAKAGVNVGLKKGGPKRAPHGHLVALGTEERFRKHIGGKFKYLDDAAQKNQELLSTGSMPANDFVGRGYNKAIGKALETLERRVEKKLESELKRIERSTKG